MAAKSISTKKGDDGSTGLLGRARVAKDHVRPETYGTLDEAAAFLGLARAKTSSTFIKDFILLVQNHLYLINAELACPAEHLPRLQKKLTAAHLHQLEERSTELEAQLDLPPKFVLYGQCETSAVLDIARAVVRRAERRFVALQDAEEIENQTMAAYLNRLSDSLFLLARYAEVKAGVDFIHPGE